MAHGGKLISPHFDSRAGEFFNSKNNPTVAPDIKRTVNSPVRCMSRPVCSGLIWPFLTLVTRSRHSENGKITGTRRLTLTSFCCSFPTRRDGAGSVGSQSAWFVLFPFCLNHCLWVGWVPKSTLNLSWQTCVTLQLGSGSVHCEAKKCLGDVALLLLQNSVGRGVILSPLSSE